MREFVEFVEAVMHALVFIGEHGELAVFQGHPGDHADGAIEDPGGAFVIVVPQLRDLVTDPEHAAAVAAFGVPFLLWGEHFLQKRVEIARTGRPPVHRRQYLDVAARVHAEAARDAASHDVRRQPRRFRVRSGAGYWSCCAGFRPWCLVRGFPWVTVPPDVLGAGTGSDRAGGGLL